MGIRINSDLSAAVTSRLGVKGVLILDVTEGGGAQSAGLRGTVIGQTNVVQLGDIVQKVGDRDVTSVNDLLEALERYDSGDSVSVEYLREGERQTTSVGLD
jgi:putative serine protease PepD